MEDVLAKLGDNKRMRQSEDLAHRPQKLKIDCAPHRELAPLQLLHDSNVVTKPNDAQDRVIVSGAHRIMLPPTVHSATPIPPSRQ